VNYERNPESIYRKSFSIARAESRLEGLTRAEAEVAIRVVHACGMPEVASRLVFARQAVEAGCAALAGGASILCDSQMVASGITQGHLPADNPVMTTIDDPRVPELASMLETTRSAVAVDLWRPFLSDAVVAIGNAPTALFRLLEILAEGKRIPALIVAMPVGFVGASESKAALMEEASGVPHITLPGRLGGSAMTAAAVNALALFSQSPTEAPSRTADGSGGAR